MQANNETFESPPAEAGSAMSRDKRPTRYIDTNSAYDQWAPIYDTDGNILQKIDDLELTTLLPDFLDAVRADNPDRLTLVDLGCGTGRNTVKLRDWAVAAKVEADIVGLDASAGMLAVAATRLQLTELDPAETTAVNVQLKQYDALTASSDTLVSNADAVISTLVLEHLPLEEFFRTAKGLLKPGGLLLMTNMHPDMGLYGAQAGFTNEQGERVKGKSWWHGVQETRDAAESAGFTVAGVYKERKVEKDVLELLGERGKKWIDVKVWYGGVFRLSK